jgi:hypothetical protein
MNTNPVTGYTTHQPTFIVATTAQADFEVYEHGKEPEGATTHCDPTSYIQAQAIACKLRNSTPGPKPLPGDVYNRF